MQSIDSCIIPDIDLSSLPSLPLDRRDELPLCSAVYFAATAASYELFYIGQAMNLRLRWGPSHHRLAQLQQIEGIHIYWLEVPEAYLLDVERAYIDMLNPPLNGARLPQSTTRAGSIRSTVTIPDPRAVARIRAREADGMKLQDILVEALLNDTELDKLRKKIERLERVIDALLDRSNVRI